MVLWKFDSLPEKLIIFKVMKMRLWKAAGVPLMVVSAALSGVMAVSCKSEVDGPEVEHICNFGDGDLSRAIPAEGGNVVLFDGNDVSSGKYYDWCYAIDLPLDVIDNSDEGGFALLSKELIGENKKLRRVQFEDYRFGNFIDGGDLPDPGCELYFSRMHIRVMLSRDMPGCTICRSIPARICRIMQRCPAGACCAFMAMAAPLSKHCRMTPARSACFRWFTIW